MSLNDLGVFYHTDKSDMCHDYLTVFETFMAPKKDKEITLLEMGVSIRLRSIRMWKDYFTNGKFYALDNSIEIFEKIKEFEMDWLTFNLIDLHNKVEVREVAKTLPMMDFIIDDADHKADSIILCFQTFWKHIKPGGYYIIEDTTRSFRPGPDNAVLKYFCNIIVDLNCNALPGAHNFRQVKKKVPFVSETYERIESITFRSEVIIIKFREDL